MDVRFGSTTQPIIADVPTVRPHAVALAQICLRERPRPPHWRQACGMCIFMEYDTPYHSVYVDICYICQAA